MLFKNKLIKEGYQLAVESALKKSSWTESQDCVIIVQFPFPIERREYIESDSWYVFCFHEKVEQEKAKASLTDLDF